MVDTKALEDRIKKLEQRVSIIEDKILFPESDENRNWEEALYKKATELVVKNNKTSAIFLQRKLMIDYQRAVTLLDKLEKEGVLGPVKSDGKRSVLTKKL